MIISHPGEAPGDLGRAHVIIIGAGTTGLFLADKLVQRGLTVILIESGEMLASTAPARETAVAAGRSHGGTFDGRAIGLGGASTLWGGQLVAFDPEDFDRSYAPWPISHADVSTHYRDVFQRFGLKIESNRHYGRLLGGESPQGDHPIERFFTPWLPQPNFARYFQPMIQRSPAAQICLGCTATDLELTGDRIAAVRANWRGQSWCFQGQKVVIATGTIGSIRLLLATGSSGAKPWTGHPELGRGFQDHFSLPIGEIKLVDERRFRDLFENAVVAGVKLQPKLRWSRRARQQRGPGFPGASAMIRANSDLAEHLANLKQTARSIGSVAGLAGLKEGPRALMGAGRNLVPFVRRYIQDRRILSFWDKGLSMIIQAEQFPHAKSQITLAGPEQASDGLPKVKVEWRIRGDEVGPVADFTRAVGAYLETSGSAQLVPNPSIFDQGGAFLEAARDTNHPAGGARMAASAADGLVDGQLRMFGTRNLFLLSAATFPSSSHANCTFTILALANRLGEELIRSMATEEAA